MHSQKLVSVVLPAYNEKDNLIALVTKIAETLAQYRFEVIVVDDNSPDGTHEAMAELSKSIPQLSLIVRKIDRGFAYSIRDGILSAKGDYIVIMDSDGNHNPDYLPFMIENMNYFDCVTASRFQYGGTMDSRSRHLLSWIFNVFVRICTSGMITDSLYGFCIIKREKILGLDFKKIFWGYGDYCIRLFYYLQKDRLKILQFPAINGHRFYGEGNSKMVRVFVKYFKEVIKLTYRIRITRDV